MGAAAGDDGLGDGHQHPAGRDHQRHDHGRVHQVHGPQVEGLRGEGAPAVPQHSLSHRLLVAPFLDQFGLVHGDEVGARGQRSGAEDHGHQQGRLGTAAVPGVGEQPAGGQQRGGAAGEAVQHPTGGVGDPTDAEDDTEGGEEPASEEQDERQHGEEDGVAGPLVPLPEHLEGEERADAEHDQDGGPRFRRPLRARPPGHAERVHRHPAQHHRGGEGREQREAEHRDGEHGDGGQDVGGKAQPALGVRPVQHLVSDQVDDEPGAGAQQARHPRLGGGDGGGLAWGGAGQPDRGEPSVAGGGAEPGALPGQGQHRDAEQQQGGDHADVQSGFPEDGVGVLVVQGHARVGPGFGIGDGQHVQRGEHRQGGEEGAEGGEHHPQGVGAGSGEGQSEESGGFHRRPPVGAGAMSAPRPVGSTAPSRRVISRSA